MTVTPTGAPSGEMEMYDPSRYSAEGLDDFSMADAVMPRIRILGKEAQWADNLSNTPFPALDFIPLGLVKQRSLFHPTITENDKGPMCKSNDHDTGYPNLERRDFRAFPWQIAGFNPNDFPPDKPGGPVKLPCASCQLKNWGSHPTSEAPYCAEQFTLPIYYNTTTDGSDPVWSPAIVTFQKSSLAAVKAFLTIFKNSNRAPFLSIARGTLKAEQRGDVIYSKPSFTVIGESPRERWAEFSEQYKEVRAFLQQPPTSFEEDGATPPVPAQNNTYTGPAQQAPQQDYTPPPQQQAPPQAPQQQYAPPAAPQPPVQQYAPPVQPEAPQQYAPPPAQPEAPQQYAPPAPQPQQNYAQPPPQQAAPVEDPWATPPPQQAAPAQQPYVAPPAPAAQPGVQDPTYANTPPPQVDPWTNQPIEQGPPPQQQPPAQQAPPQQATPPAQPQPQQAAPPPAGQELPF